MTAIYNNACQVLLVDGTYFSNYIFIFYSLLRIAVIYILHDNFVIRWKRKDSSYTLSYRRIELYIKWVYIGTPNLIFFNNRIQLFSFMVVVVVDKDEWIILDTLVSVGWEVTTVGVWLVILTLSQEDAWYMKHDGIYVNRRRDDFIHNWFLIIKNDLTFSWTAYILNYFRDG